MSLTVFPPASIVTHLIILSTILSPQHPELCGTLAISEIIGNRWSLRRQNPVVLPSLTLQKAQFQLSRLEEAFSHHFLSVPYTKRLRQSSFTSVLAVMNYAWVNGIGGLRVSMGNSERRLEITRRWRLRLESVSALACTSGIKILPRRETGLTPRIWSRFLR